MTIEVKIAKNGRINAKVNGKRAAINTLSELVGKSLRNNEQVELIASDGHKFTCTGYDFYEFAHPLCRRYSFNFMDDAGNTFPAYTMTDAIYTVDKFASGEYKTRNIFAEYAVTEEAMDIATEAEIENAQANDVKVTEQDNSNVTIGDEIVTYINGKFDNVYSRKYGAWLEIRDDGEIAYWTHPYHLNSKKIDTRDADRWDFEDFFQIVAERGAGTIDTPEPPTVDPEEYVVAPAAFDIAVRAEEQAAWGREIDELGARREARILADPVIDAKYQKACERVKIEFGKYGIPMFYYRKKGSDEWNYNERTAKAFLTKCGLTEFAAIVKARVTA